MSRRKRPQIGDRVHSVQLAGRLGHIVDWQAGTAAAGKQESWLVRPEKPGQLSRWLTINEFTSAPGDDRRRWL